MHEASGKGVSIFIQPTKIVGDVAVCLCFPLGVSGCALARLTNQLACDCFEKGAEEACVFYATYDKVRFALCGDPAAVLASKVASVTCGASGSHVHIAWQVKGTASAVRKSLGIALKALKPRATYAAYQRLVHQLGRKPVRAHFNYAADQVTNAIKRGVHCGVVGKIMVGKPSPKLEETMRDILDVIVKRLDPGEVVGDREKPSDHSACNTELVALNVSGWQAFAASEYITAKVMGVRPVVCGDKIIVPVKKKLWDALAAKLKKGVDVVIKNRYAKLGEELGNVLAYTGVISGAMSCADVKPLLKEKITPAAVASAIKRVL